MSIHTNLLVYAENPMLFKAGDECAKFLVQKHRILSQGALSIILAVIGLCGTTYVQAGILANTAKKVMGVALGALSASSALYTSGLGGDLLRSISYKAVEITSRRDVGVIVLLGGLVPVIPVALIDTRLNHLDKNISLAAQLTFIAVTGYGSYKLLKPVAK